MTITLLRASKPKKAIRELQESGYKVENAYPGIYYISGMVDFKMQLVVSSELVGDDYIPLRLQRKNADREDYIKFAKNIKSVVYNESEIDYVTSVMKYGIYDDFEEVISLMAEDESMRTTWKDYFKDDLEAARAEGRAEGEAKGEEIRKDLEERIKKLEEELKKVKVASL